MYVKTTVPRVGTTSAAQRPVATDLGRLEPLRALAEILRSTLEADGVLIASHSGGGDGRVVSAVDEGVTDDVLTVLLPVVARVQRNRRALGPVQALRDVDPIGVTALAASGISDALCAPLEIDDERVGMLVLLYRRTTRPDGATVMPFARHVAVALAQIQQLAAPSLPAQVAEIRDAFDRVALSTTDPEDLTGVVADTVARIRRGDARLRRPLARQRSRGQRAGAHRLSRHDRRRPAGSRHAPRSQREPRHRARTMSMTHPPATLENERQRRADSFINGYLPPKDLVIDPSLELHTESDSEIDPISY